MSTKTPNSNVSKPKHKTSTHTSNESPVKSTAPHGAPQVQLTPLQNKYLPYVLAVALFMQILDATILNTALPEMAKALGESPLKMQWAVISYALTLAVFIPISGFMADKFGTRKTFLTAVVIFSIGSILCAISPNFDILIVSRVIQGIGGAMMTPVARLILVKSYPRNKLLTVMNFAVIPALIAPLLGPLLGGYIVEYASWEWIFLINIPMGLVGLALGYKLVPDLREITDKLDWRGFILFALAASTLTFAVEKVSNPGDTMFGIVSIFIGIALLIGYVIHARRCRAALFPLALFDTRTFKIGIVGNLFTRLGISAVPYLMPLLLQVAFKYTPSQAGWLLTPIAVGAMGIKPLVSKIIQRFSYRKVLVANTTLLGLLIILLAQFDANVSWYWFVPLLLIMGACNSMQFSAMNTITIGDLEGTETSSGNSLMAVNQQLAMSFGIAFGAAVLTLFSEQIQLELIASFHATFWIMGIITIVSGLYFLKLKPNDGEGLY